MAVKSDDLMQGDILSDGAVRNLRKDQAWYKEI